MEGIARSFATPGGETTVFADLWLAMRRGEFACVIGHSGCGKTTLLNILAGLDQPSEGVVIVDEQAIEGPSLDRAVIFQSHALLPCARPWGMSPTQCRRNGASGRPRRCGRMRRSSSTSSVFRAPRASARRNSPAA